MQANHFTINAINSDEKQQLNLKNNKKLLRKVLGITFHFAFNRMSMVGERKEMKFKLSRRRDMNNDMVQCNAMQCNAMQCNAMAIQLKAMALAIHSCDAMQ